MPQHIPVDSLFNICLFQFYKQIYDVTINSTYIEGSREFQEHLDKLLELLTDVLPHRYAIHNKA